MVVQTSQKMEEKVGKEAYDIGEKKSIDDLTD